MSAERIADLIATLWLRPHPEGGLYAELHRSGLQVRRADGQTRSALTTIYFLLPGGAVSRWHRVEADEIWHHYEGAPLALSVLEPGAASPVVRTLGPVGGHARPVQVVPAGAWQSARSLGEYTLVGCSVGPGFEFADFSLLEDLPPAERPAGL